PIRYPSAPRISTLSLHDALPISSRNRFRQRSPAGCAECLRVLEVDDAVSQRRLSIVSSKVGQRRNGQGAKRILTIALDQLLEGRSEEHTSELQSRENLVCRLLLE